MRRLPMTIAGAMSAGLLLAACGDDASTTSGDGEMNELTLTLNWVPYGEHAPFYYGVSEGIYEDEGIDLTIQPGNGSGNTIQQVAQGNTDLGWADTPPMVNGISEGMPVKSLGVFLQRGPSSVEFFADSDISSLDDLRGKTVAGTPGDAMYATFPVLLEMNGIDPEDVEVVNVDAAGKIAALVEGRVDAVQGFFHDQAPTIAETAGKEVDVMLFADNGMNLLGTGIIANERMIEESPEVAEAFVRATQESWSAAIDDPEAAVAVMQEDAEQTPSNEVMLDQMAQMTPLLNLEEVDAPGVNTEEQWTETLDLLEEHTELDEAEEPDTYWDGSFADTEEQS